jgi:SAM-dependent methyltransferase
MMDADMASFSVNENSAVYYGNTYWNDLPQVTDEINRRLSGDPQRGWSHVFADLVDGRVFKRALILNCGNGHVERGLFAQGLIEECVGIDYAEDLLEQARRDNAEYPATYHQMDVNTAAFPEQAFDLVVNFAAAHHIARIDKVFRALCELLDDDGWFVSYDYVGAHRNQFGYDLWEAAHRLNETLPVEVRQDLGYPHLPTMLATDPTEAIHSELILESFGRYFDEADRRLVGGALAYPILTHNAAVFAAEPAVRDPWIEHVLTADAAYTEAHPELALFAYFAGQPRKDVLEHTADLARWTEEEEAREDLALANGGEYGARSVLQDLYLRLHEQQVLLAERGIPAVPVGAAPSPAASSPGPIRWLKARVAALLRRWPALDRRARSVLAWARQRRSVGFRAPFAAKSSRSGVGSTDSHL